jgi:Family of unknown function (DUF5684)
MDDIMATLQKMLIFIIVLTVVMIVVYWMIYEKAGQPGWASIVPFYNTYVLIVNILQMPPFWFWGLLIPILNIFVAIPLIFMIPFKLAEKFGKGGLFGLGLLFLQPIFLALLAFGPAKYEDRSRTNRPLYEVDEVEEGEDRPARGGSANW